MSATAEAHADLDLSLAIGKLTAAVDRNRSDLDRILARFPILADFAYSGVAGAGGGTLFIGGEGPAQGQVWEIRRWTVTGTDPTAAAAGTLYSFIGTPPSNVSPAGLGTMYIDKTLVAFPTTAYYNEGQIVMRYPERMFFFITTPTASLPYVVSGTAIQYPDASMIPMPTP